jgi:hypothetical protein
MALVSHHQLKEMGHDPGYYPVSADASGGVEHERACERRIESFGG